MVHPPDTSRLEAATEASQRFAGFGGRGGGKSWIGKQHGHDILAHLGCFRDRAHCENPPSSSQNLQWMELKIGGHGGISEGRKKALILGIGRCIALLSLQQLHFTTCLSTPAATEKQPQPK